MAALATHLAVHGLDPHPATVLDPRFAGSPGVYVQEVVGVNLPQPGVLRIPGVVHRHRPLGNRIEWVLVQIGYLSLQRLRVERQGIKMSFHALAQVVRRLFAV